ncbi:MAG: hypothetical protein ABSE45_09195 [Candidatus Acidiferrales bacterium]
MNRKPTFRPGDPIEGRRALRSVRFLAAVGIWLAFGFAVPGRSVQHSPSPSAVTPTTDQILNRYFEATGGRAAWQKLTSRVSKGTIEVASMNLSGTIEIDEKAPDRILSVITIAGASFRQAFDGTIGWTDDPENGVREQSGAELAETRRDADFYHPLDLKKLYTSLTVTGIEKVGDRDAYVVEAATAEGDPDRIFFDTVTGLPVRIISHRHGPNGPIDSVEDFEDFRDVDGIKLPFTIHQKTSETTLTIQINEMHHNVSLDDSQFARPAVQ